MLNAWVGSTRRVTACSALPEIDRYCKNLFIGIISERLNQEKVLAFGEKFFDMVENMNFWGTLKIKKFQNMLIKVYEDEICSTSVWYHWKARSSQIIKSFEILIPDHSNDEIMHF